MWTKGVAVLGVILARCMIACTAATPATAILAACTLLHAQHSLHGGV